MLIRYSFFLILFLAYSSRCIILTKIKLSIHLKIFCFFLLKDTYSDSGVLSFLQTNTIKSFSVGLFLTDNDIPVAIVTDIRVPAIKVLALNGNVLSMLPDGNSNFNFGYYACNRVSY